MKPSGWTQVIGPTSRALKNIRDLGLKVILMLRLDASYSRTTVTVIHLFFLIANPLRVYFTPPPFHVVPHCFPAIMFYVTKQRERLRNKTENTRDHRKVTTVNRKVKWSV